MIIIDERRGYGYNDGYNDEVVIVDRNDNYGNNYNNNSSYNNNYEDKGIILF